MLFFKAFVFIVHCIALCLGDSQCSPHHPSTLVDVSADELRDGRWYTQRISINFSEKAIPTSLFWNDFNMEFGENGTVILNGRQNYDPRRCVYDIVKFNKTEEPSTWRTYLRKRNFLAKHMTWKFLQTDKKTYILAWGCLYDEKHPEICSDWFVDTMTRRVQDDLPKKIWADINDAIEKTVCKANLVSLNNYKGDDKTMLLFGVFAFVVYCSASCQGDGQCSPINPPTLVDVSTDELRDGRWYTQRLSVNFSEKVLPKSLFWNDFNMEFGKHGKVYLNGRQNFYPRRCVYDEVKFNKTEERSTWKTYFHFIAKYLTWKFLQTDKKTYILSWGCIYDKNGSEICSDWFVDIRTRSRKDNLPKETWEEINEAIQKTVCEANLVSLHNYRGTVCPEFKKRRKSRESII